MGEAKRRREAREAGRPWERDLPKVDEHAGQYLGDDGLWHHRSEKLSQRPRDAGAAALLVALAALGGRR